MEETIVRENLMTKQGYRPYCGSGICSNPRTRFNGQQFICPECNWVSNFPNEFMDKYKLKWNIKVIA